MKKPFLILFLLADFACYIQAATLSGSLTNGLVGYYNFDGNYNDSSTANNNLNNSGASLSTDRFGYSNSSLSVSPTSYLQSAKNIGISGNQNHTISLWVNLNELRSQVSATVSFGNISGQNVGGVQGVIVDGQSGGRVNIWGANADVWHSGFGSYFLNSWHMVTFSYNGANSSSSLYVDGSAISFSYGGSSNTLNIVDSPLYVNSLARFSAWSGINGSIDDVAIYNRSLSSGEVSSLYVALVPEPSTYALLGIGMIGMLIVIRKKKSSMI